jgi:microcompartment protein CcmL/EutN
VKSLFQWHDTCLKRKNKKMSTSIGILEMSSIAAGFLVQDAMLKAAEVELLIARTICPGKYIVVVGGKVAAVKAAMSAGELLGGGFSVDRLILSHIDIRVFPALSGCVELPGGRRKALGIIETFSAATIVKAADAAVKAADVTLFKVHIAMAIGGKGFLLVCGDVGAVKASVAAGVDRIKEEGMLVNKVVISNASKELFKEYV